MNSFKRVVAITLCFCFVILSSSSFQVDASVDKGYVRSVKSYLRRHSFKAKYYKYDYLNNTGNGYVYAEDEYKLKTIDIYFANSKKKTNRIYISELQDWAATINEKKRQSLNIKKLSRNTFRIISKYDGWWGVAVVKKDTYEHRVFYYIRWYYSKKHMKRKIRNQLKLINKLNNLY